MWIVINPICDALYLFDSKETATKRCLAMNKRDPDHPAFLLYKCKPNGKAVYVGKLWRAFFSDFNKENPWKKY